MKHCNNCKIDKEINEFGKNKYGKDGLRSICKICTRKQCKVYHSKNKEKMKTWRKNWDKNNPDGRRNLSLRNKYGINVQIYEQMLTYQNNSCAICKTHKDKLYKRLSVDHNHKTGQIRGLLCDDCNRALGLFKDSVSSLSESILYLQKKR